MKFGQYLYLTLAVAIYLVGNPILARAKEEPKDNGSVTLPLPDYAALINQSDPHTRDPRPSLNYSLGEGRISATITEEDSRATITVDVTLSLSVLESKWVSIPILPVGTAVDSVTIGGKPIGLVSLADGLVWQTNEAGSYTMVIRYRLDARRSAQGFSLALPTPEAAATKLQLSLPGEGRDVGVIPVASLESESADGNTLLSASVPPTRFLYLSWVTTARRDYALSRATYIGSLEGDAIIWKGTFQLTQNVERVNVPLFRSSVTLTNVTVDGTQTPLALEGDCFTTSVKGTGNHELVVEFQIPVSKSDQPPFIEFPIPQVPISKIELTLPGKRELQVTPETYVTHNRSSAKTTASFAVPLSDTLRLTWSEAVPEEIEAELRANATLYQSVYAEEGVLYLRTIADYEISRGETSEFQFDIPVGIQISRIESTTAIVSDWRVVDGEAGNTLHIFLDRKVKGEFRIDIAYDRSLAGAEISESIELPLFRARGMNRQRGMVAVLSSKEIALRPTVEENVTRIGENQLPAHVRETISHTVAHTFKYFGNDVKLAVQPTAPERVQGKFDSLVDTLISLSDVSLKGSVTVQVNIKSGTISELKFKLPEKVNVLGLTAPSLRTYKVNHLPGTQEVDVQFTQEMEGVFRVETTYELITELGDAEVSVPTLQVLGAEVEQGKIAVEALSAVEVKPQTIEQLSTLEPSELPKQLILKTTNPILLAYKYVRNDPPYTLGLQITRHREIDVEPATIDSAHYQTLVTENGLAVTNAQFMVRNARKQFLRITLPKHSKPWAVFVDGKPEKPALVSGAEGTTEVDGESILIKIVTSADGFPVQLVYETKIPEIHHFGRVKAYLPRPDVVVTKSRWDLYLPDDFHYGRVSGNMKLLEAQVAVSGEMMKRELLSAEEGKGAPAVIDPLRIEIPATGVRYSMEKLYANKSADEVEVKITYLSQVGNYLAVLIGCGATFLFWFGVLGLLGSLKTTYSQKQLISAISVGVVAFSGALGYFEIHYIGPLLVTLIMLGVVVSRTEWSVRYLRFFPRKLGDEGAGSL